jgi:glycosyltransferase involved in cell wall biosynthesis
MKIQYVGPALDFSGYGEANRHDIAALTAANVQVTCKIPTYVRDKAEFGTLGQLVMDLRDKQMGYEYQILHTTPDQFKRYAEDGMYHIGRVFWETDKLPKEFADSTMLMDEVWTGSQFNADAIRNAGVEVPIYIIPEAVAGDLDPKDIKPYKVNAEGYKFYSIFEWTERKNPKALLEAYWREFEGQEDVSLILKTYVDNFTDEKKQEIKQQIRKLKSVLQLNSYAPVYLYLDLMDRHQIYRFHQTGDCFVSAHRGEGWGIPQMEALLMGKPMISTNLGGIHEYLTDGKDSMLVDCSLEKISQNTRNPQWYAVDQRWGEVDKTQLQDKLRWAFEIERKQLSLD